MFVCKLPATSASAMTTILRARSCHTSITSHPQSFSTPLALHRFITDERCATGTHGAADGASRHGLLPQTHAALPTHAQVPARQQGVRPPRPQCDYDNRGVQNKVLDETEGCHGIAIRGRENPIDEAQHTQQHSSLCRHRSALRLWWLSTFFHFAPSGYLIVSSSMARHCLAVCAVIMTHDLGPESLTH